MSNVICNICGEKGTTQYYSQTMTYYRNKASGHYYFCSEACKTIFDHTKKCKYCGYYDDLIPTEDGFMLCTSDEHWNPTCYEKYLLRIYKDDAGGNTVDALYDVIGNHTIPLDNCESEND